MRKEVEKIKGEHKIILGLFKNIKKFSLKNNDSKMVLNKAKSFEKIWNAHEKFEDSLMNESSDGEKSPVEKSIINQHRELKGHWKVITNYIKSGDKNKIEVAFETDGEMLISKLKNHMAQEEEFFSRI